MSAPKRASLLPVTRNVHQRRGTGTASGEMGKISEMAGRHSSHRKARTFLVVNGGFGPGKFRRASGAFSRDKFGETHVFHVVRGRSREPSQLLTMPELHYMVFESCSTRNHLVVRRPHHPGARTPHIGVEIGEFSLGVVAMKRERTVTSLRTVGDQSSCIV